MPISVARASRGSPESLPAWAGRGLRGETSVLAAAQKGWSDNVWILATAHDPEAGDLLARRFTDVIEEAKESFDLILIDTPPLLSTDDARTMATMAKGILLVVTRGTLARSLSESVLAIEALRRR